MILRLIGYDNSYNNFNYLLGLDKNLRAVNMLDFSFQYSILTKVLEKGVIKNTDKNLRIGIIR